MVSFVTFVDIFFAFSGLVQKYKRPVFLQYQLEVLDFFKINGYSLTQDESLRFQSVISGRCPVLNVGTQSDRLE